MLTTLHCIALNTVKYSDRNNILTAYSEEMGRVSLLIPAGSSKSARTQRSATSPLSRFECVAKILPGREIYQISDLKLSKVDVQLRSNPVKMTIAFFMTETLGTLIRETQSDKHLYRYIDYSIDTLENTTMPVANFNIAFMLGLSVALGIAPDMTTYGPMRYFDMIDGIFRPTPPMHKHFLSIADSRTAGLISRITFRNFHRYRLNRTQRNEILDTILQYFDLHYTSLTALKSLDILRTFYV